MIFSDAARWRAATTVVALCGSLASCAALSPAPNLTTDEKKALSTNLNEKYVAYQDCMASEADRFSHITSAPPSDIAKGAQAGCEAAFRSYHQAVTKQFTSFVSSAGQAEARSRAEQHASDAKDRTWSHVIQRVLLQRQ
ncbi:MULTISPECIES: hypothetical protein [unclassified Marinobacter]|uniref:hypothetical protein n=1 Tax=unclassified Marinobacter TaxID=83889 RepID=UPI0026E17EBD|nr:MULTISPECIES: hypothetical protein [unclassified Marinobacter]MDO6442048.1 hypothetical protein [Marinobacter sp. 2_MG-2023]MDO6825601.1 hypothetical protein [Marinobacter sp. 1_MG-2023]